MVNYDVISYKILAILFPKFVYRQALCTTTSIAPVDHQCMHATTATNTHVHTPYTTGLDG